MDIGEALITLVQFGILVLMLGFVVVAVPRVVAMFRRGADNRDGRSVTPPFCPECGYDLRATPNECPECGVIVADRRRYLRALGRDWPASAIEPCMPHRGVKITMVELLCTDNPTEADLLGQQLKARGVRCAVTQRRSTQTRVHAIHDPQFFQISVPAADERMAREYVCRAQGVPAELVEPVLSGQRKVVVA